METFNAAVTEGVVFNSSFDSTWEDVMKTSCAFVVFHVIFLVLRGTIFSSGRETTDTKTPCNTLKVITELATETNSNIKQFVFEHPEF